jgi:hypothetical protein
MSFWIVSSRVIVILRFVVAGAAHVLVLVDSSGSRGCVGRRSALDAAFEDAFDMATVRRALAGNRKRSLTSGIHRRGAVFLCDADDAEHGPVAHFRLRVLGHGAARNFRHVSAETSSPLGHALWRPLAIVRVLSWPMRGVRDGSAGARIAAAVRRYADVAVKTLEDAARRAHIDEFPAQGKRHAVAPVVE